MAQVSVCVISKRLLLRSKTVFNIHWWGYVQRCTKDQKFHWPQEVQTSWMKIEKPSKIMKENVETHHVTYNFWYDLLTYCTTGSHKISFWGLNYGTLSQKNITRWRHQVLLRRKLKIGFLTINLAELAKRIIHVGFWQKDTLETYSLISKVFWLCR